MGLAVNVDPMINEPPPFKELVIRIPILILI